MYDEFDYMHDLIDLGERMLDLRDRLPEFASVDAPLVRVLDELAAVAEEALPLDEELLDEALGLDCDCEECVPAVTRYEYDPRVGGYRQVAA
jgi:hypothetical protein